jgi:HlyD family secretion protein
MNARQENPQAEIARVLDDARPGRRRLWRWLLLVLLVAGGAAAFLLLGNGGETAAARYQTEPASRGALRVTVTATGTLEPTNQVDVGSELSGIVRAVAVDYNDRVTVGQVLARLDTAKLEAAVQRSRAALASAEARVLQAAATVKETRAELARLRKVAELSGGKVPSQAELDAAAASVDRAQADRVAARAAVAEARATLESNETDLGKADIVSPIAGIVLAREVEPGQTVAASLQAPVLFTLAEDLAQMELHVDVDEADVGQVRDGQSAQFTVDAYPERRFPARIVQVRYGAQTVEGVVTYETVLTVDNADLALRPGMTATAEITVQRVEDALLVPNAALRFTPPRPDAGQRRQGGSLLSQLMPRPPRSSRRQPEETGNGRGAARVFVLRDGQPVPVPVKVGTSDGLRSQVLDGDLQPGTELVVGVLRAGR